MPRSPSTRSTQKTSALIENWPPVESVMLSQRRKNRIGPAPYYLSSRKYLERLQARKRSAAASEQGPNLESTPSRRLRRSPSIQRSLRIRRRRPLNPIGNDMDIDENQAGPSRSSSSSPSSPHPVSSSREGLSPGSAATTSSSPSAESVESLIQSSPIANPSASDSPSSDSSSSSSRRSSPPLSIRVLDPFSSEELDPTLSPTVAASQLRAKWNALFDNLLPSTIARELGSAALSTQPSSSSGFGRSAFHPFRPEGLNPPRQRTLLSLHDHLSHLYSSLNGNMHLFLTALSRLQSSLKLDSHFFSPSLQLSPNPEPASAAEEAFFKASRSADEIASLMSLVEDDLSWFRHFQ